MVYYIIDVRAPRAFKEGVQLNKRIIPEGEISAFKDFEYPFLYHFVYPSQSIRMIVQDTRNFMLKAKWVFGTVDMIRLDTHGNSGWLQLGQGLDESNVAEFGALAVFMKNDLYNIGVEIHGCGVGSDTSY